MPAAERLLADEEEILAAESHAAERALGGVVVEWDAGVIEETTELLPMSERVADGDADRTLG